MSAFPTMLYKSPGIYQKPNGKSYSLISVHGQEELDEKLANGWFPSSAAAIEAAGDNAFPPSKPRPKWATKPVKKKKPARPLDWREQAKAKAAAAAVAPERSGAVRNPVFKLKTSYNSGGRKSGPDMACMAFSSESLFTGVLAECLLATSSTG